MNNKKILNLCNELMLNNTYVSEINEYLEYNELGIAFETLCSIIDTDNIKINKKIYIEISKIGKELLFEESDWDFLRKNLV